MIEISYPKNKKEFEKEYLALFDIQKIEKAWEDELKSIDKNSKQIFDSSIKKLLLLPFNKLLEIYKKFPKNEKSEDIKKSIYTEYQPEIAKFFMKYSKEINLKTCYFCNIDFINTVNFDVLDILKEGTKQELKELDGIGDIYAEAIIDYRENNVINTIQDITNIKGINNVSKIEESIVVKNHFTLDHFLPKAECPILALSLYNFVPSCYSCNSKFKKEIKLLESYLSPTSKDFSVGKDIKFKAYYKDKVKKSNLTLEMKYPKNIQSYILTFKLKGRYEFHKNEAFELIEKQEKYSETRIDEIANILKISPHQVKKDIFGKELFEGDIQDKSFTKMKRDVAKNIGIKGVKE